MDNPALHTLEHLGATFLRSHPVWKDRTAYFGPMGCRTGFYLILEGPLTSKDILPLVKEFLEWTVAFQGFIPGASAKECGNWQDQNLDMAKWEARKYLGEVLTAPKHENLHYPE